MIPGQRSAVGALSDRTAIAVGVSGFGKIVAIPFQFFMGMLSVGVMVLVACGILMLLAVTVAENSSPVMSLVLSVYNVAIGPVVNATLDMFAISYGFLRTMIPVYNTFAYIFTQLIIQIVGPWVWEFADTLPALLSNAAFAVTAFILSLKDWVLHISACADSAPASQCVGIEACGAVFVNEDLNCFANPAYLSIDVMTTGIYTRRVAIQLQELLTDWNFKFTAATAISDFCSVASILLNLATYPLLDFNLYKVVHNVVNIFFYGSSSLTMGTMRRCDYVRHHNFNAVEIAVACTPDFTPLVSLISETFRTVGRLIDNWLNQGMSIALELITGIRDQCDILSLRQTVEEVSEAFDEDTHRIRIVGLSDNVLGITNGISCMFRSPMQKAWSAFLWPFEVDIRFGVAAVQLSGDSLARTGMLGCRCLDGSNGIELWCATVAMFVDGQDDDGMYNTSTIHSVKFEGMDLSGLTCDRTLVKISPLRFTRQRLAKVGRFGKDVNAFDPYDTFGTGTRTFPYSVDAAIYVQPLCGGLDSTCLPSPKTCYPWCMGLHVSETMAQNISILAAYEWEEYVSVRQTDCGVELNDPSSTCDESQVGEVKVETTQSGQFTSSMCGISSQACISNSVVNSNVKITSPVFLNNPVIEQKQSTGYVLRGSGQPFAVAGDIFLTIEKNVETGNEYVSVNRLYDGGGGLFGIGEQLTLIRNQRPVPIIDCEISDSICASSAIDMGGIVRPKSYFEYPSDRIPAVNSRWGIHWAINPELGVLNAIWNFCHSGIASTTIIVDSSWGPARVWTMKTMRALDFAPSTSSSANEDIDAQNTQSATYSTSYMVVPGFLDSQSFVCGVVTNLRVVDLEYLNPQNVLVTVLMGKPRDVDPLTGDVCATCFKQYAYYYLHPERHDCIQQTQDFQNKYTCWRSEREGPWPSEDETILFGYTCPAIQRMPPLGGLLAELAVLPIAFLKLVLESVVVISAAVAGGGWPGLAEVMRPRIGRLTFHSMLDSSGANLLSVDDLNYCLEQSSLFLAQSLIKVSAILDSRPGSEFVRNVILGTAKIVQYSDGLIPSADPVSRQVSAIHDIPSAKIVSSIGTMTTSMGSPGAMTMVGQIMVSSSRVTKLNLMLMRRVLIRLLRATGVVDAISGILLAAIYESKEDFDNFFSAMRMQCQGLSEVIGNSNPFAKMLRHACHLSPTSMEFVLTVARVILVEYSVMSCACRLSTEDRVNPENGVLAGICLKRFSPAIHQAWMLRLLYAPDNLERRDMCFASMDGANRRLLTALDGFLARVYLITQNLPESLEYLISFVTKDKSGCDAYLLSPFVISLIPEPVDYFMGCLHVPDCRVRCLSEFEAFENLMIQSYSGSKIPKFLMERTFTVESFIFDPYESQQGLQRPPFELFSQLELPANLCLARCNVYGRCFVTAGRDDSGVIQLATYCTPIDLTMSVFQLNTISYTNSALAVDMFMLTGYKADGEWIVVVERDVDKTYVQLVLPGQIKKRTLLYTDAMGSVSYSTKQPSQEDLMRDVFGGLQTISSLQVIPAMERDNHAYIIVRGQQLKKSGNSRFAYLENSGFGVEIERDTICLLIDINTAEQKTNMEEVLISNTICPDSMLGSGEENYKIVCMNENCLKQLLVPISQAVASKIVIRTAVDGTSVKTIQTYKSVEYSISSKQKSQLIGVDVSAPMYQLQSGRMVLRRALLSSYTTSSDDNEAIELLMCNNNHARVASWISIVTLNLAGQQVDFTEQNSLKTNVSISMSLECSLDNCAACYNGAVDQKSNELASRCYAAQECGVARCVGTLVNMRKPLCNIGKVASRMLNVYRTTLGGAWQAIAQQIVMFVELSANRRQQYEFAWPDENFMTAICSTKDSTVQMSSIFTSLIGAIGISVNQKNLNYMSSRVGQIDSRFNARFTLSLMAMTNFISSVFLWPIYSLLAMRRMIACGANDAMAVFQNVFAPKQSGSVQMFFGKKEIQSASDSTLGVCLTASERELMRDPARESTSIVKRITDLLGGIRQLSLLQLLQMYGSAYDTAIAYGIGIITALEDVLATADEQNCRPPVINSAKIGQCACGDASYYIPNPQKSHRFSDFGWWCSGLMLMINNDGEDMIIWNPYSLDELLSVDGLTEHVDCLSGNNDCSRPPTLPALAQQGVEVMQVITQCRWNYQQNQWDDASILYSLFSPSEWQNGDFQGALKIDDEFTELRLRIKSLAGIFGFSGTIDTATHSCLQAALEFSNTKHRCHLAFTMNKNYDFVYTRNAGVSTYAQTDACRVFTGTANQFNNNASYTPYIWSSTSSNKVPVATRHMMINSYDDRMIVGKATLHAIHRDMQDFFKSFDVATEFADIQTSLFSKEGDELHQFVDCVMIGPFASAEFPRAFDYNDLPNDVSQSENLDAYHGSMLYHRNSRLSRDFVHDSEGATGGSKFRKKLMKRVVDLLADEMTSDIVRRAAINRMQEIERKLLSIDGGDEFPHSMMCKCPASMGVRASLLCCRDIMNKDSFNFGLRTLITEAGYIQNDILTDILKNVKDGELLTRDVWTDPYFMPEEVILSRSEREEMQRQYIFDHSTPIRKYSLEDVAVNIGGKTVWEDCIQMVSGSFFTMPMVDDTRVDADTIYDPLKDMGSDTDNDTPSSRYLHAMERVVEKILERAKKDSPVYWSHVNRYVPSDSVWCENSVNTALNQPIHGKTRSQPIDTHNMEIAPDQVIAPTLDDTIFPADMLSTCFCGWTSPESLCKLHSTVCNDNFYEELGGVQLDHSRSWQSLCDSGYETKEDLVFVIHVLDMFPGEWMAECITGFSSTTWGLMSENQVIEWFSGNIQTWDVDFHTLATQGPNGMRLAHHGNFDTVTTETLRLQDMRSNATGIPGVNLQYNHTVGQPICSSTLSEYLKQDLTVYFKNILFPMAHSVHGAPSSIMCSRWVIEFALQVVFTQMYKSSTDSRVQEQETIVQLWQKRCSVQLERLSTCELRGVFGVFPASAKDPMDMCGFSSPENFAEYCPELFYFTPNCLIRCNDRFFDPCKCTPDCVFAGYDNCPGGKIESHLNLIQSDQLKLKSLSWPRIISENELGSDGVAVNEQLNSINTFMLENSALIAMSDVYSDICNHILSQDVGEGQIPDGFCEDLTDYWADDAQHPVGYHPTRTCQIQDTNLRGFESWMFGTEDGEYIIDQFRMRNATLSSSVYGAAHHACDASAYGADPVEFNNIRLQTKWDPKNTLDPTIPIIKPGPTFEEMTTESKLSESIFDVPLSDPTWNGISHSVGLIRDWYVDDTEVTTDPWFGKDAWPHWQGSVLEDNTLTNGGTNRDVYSSTHPERLCSQPPLATCQTCHDCCNGDCTSCSLDCLLSPSGEGICMDRQTCFTHEHCKDQDKMCSGEGVCVRAHMSVGSNLKFDVAVQLYSAGCLRHSVMTSRYQLIPEFVNVHGLCSHKKWWAARQLSQSGNSNFPFREHYDDLISTPSIDNKTLSDVLKMIPHACERSYQHTEGYNLCTIDDIKVTPTKPGIQEGSFVKPLGYNVMRVGKFGDTLDPEDITWQTCELSGKPVTGFLDPYYIKDVEMDNLLEIPETMERCSVYKLCPQAHLHIQGQRVKKRMVMPAEAASPTSNAIKLKGKLSRPHCFYDTETCMGMGYTLADSCSEAISLKVTQCVVDILIVPTLWVVFGLHRNSQDGFENDLQLVSANDVQSVVLPRIKEHCELAFTDRPGMSPEYRIMELYSLLVGWYESSTAQTVADASNQLFLALFGIEEIRNIPLTSLSLSLYKQHSKCARYLLTKMNELSVILANVYPTETLTGLHHNVPGQAIYVTQGLQVIEVSFMWMWKCSILPGPNDGGAPVSWMKSMSQRKNALYPRCHNVDMELNNAHIYNNPATMMERFMYDSIIYTYVPPQPLTWADRILYDINHLLTEIISRLQILAVDQSDSIQCSKEIFNHARSVLFRGNKMELLWPIWTLQDWVDRGIVTRRSKTQKFQHYDTAFPVNRFTALIEMHKNLDWQLSGFQSPEDQCQYNSVEMTCELIFGDENACLRFDNGIMHRIETFNDNIKSGIGNANYEVLYYVMIILEREAHTMHSFISIDNDNDIVPDQESTYLINLFANDNSKINISKQEFDESVRYNNFMQTKLFNCDDDSEIDFAATTNIHHIQMRECVEKMSTEGGWQIKQNENLEFDLPRGVFLNGFFPTLIQSREDDEYLTNLFSSSISNQNDHVDAICFSGGDKPQLINPYWANEFDIDTGCDVRNYDGIKKIDVYCSEFFSEQNLLNCPPQLTDYTTTVLANIRAYCVEHHEEIIQRLNMGSLSRSQIPLCERSSSVNLPGKTCTRYFSTLMQYKGNEVPKLTPDTHPKQVFVGIWNEKNTIILGNSKQVASSTYVLQVLPTDIGGHSFSFNVDGDGVFFLKCMSLSNQVTAYCARSVQEWRGLTLTEFERQHQFLSLKWGMRVDSQENETIHWQCPLQYMTAFTSNALLPQFTISADRNAVRFRHITGAFMYAHPTTSRASPLPNLRPGRFISDFMTCIASSHSLSSQGHCRYNGLLKEALQGARRFEWQNLTLVDRDGLYSTCARVLDWPHESYTLRDRLSTTHKSTAWCNVYPRLNVFAMRYVRVPIQDKSTEESVSTAKGGVCRMGRLKRLPLELPSKLHTGYQSHRCWVEGLADKNADDSLSCVATFPEEIHENGVSRGKRKVMKIPFLDQATSPILKSSVSSPLRRILCSKCDAYPTMKFAKKDGSIHDLPNLSPGSRQQLSIGQITKISTERMLAHAIYKEFCGNHKSVSDCIPFQATFRPDSWKIGQFLSTIIQSPREMFHHWTEVNNDVTIPESVKIGVDDSILWRRPWVLCKNIENGQNVCEGSISKSEWIDATSRVGKCYEVIDEIQKNKPTSKSSTRVLFCMLTAKTQRLCENLAIWRDRVHLTLCQISGACPEDDFFYTPATYNPGNMEFVHDTVEQYYIHNGQSCPTSIQNIQEQIASNQQKLQKCASNYIHWIKVIFQLLRTIRESMLRIIYYYYSINISFIQVLVGALTNTADVMQDGTRSLFIYIGLMLESLIKVTMQLFLAVARIIFGGGEMGQIEKIIRSLCKFINAFMRDFIGEFVCKIVMIVAQQAAYTIAAVMDLISWIHEDIRTAADNIRNFGDEIVNGEYCNIQEFECDPEDYDDGQQGPGANTVPTRCWSTYVTFFGDTKQLSCTAADTCRKSLVSTDLVMCGTCNALDSTQIDFGCSPVTKYCTCAVPKLQHTPCLSNLECATESATCRFVDDEMSLSIGYVSCQTCQSIPMCLFQDEQGVQSSVGVCVCPLSDTTFSECSVLQWGTGKPQMAEFGHPCLYMPTRRYATTTAWTVQFGDVGVVPCQSLDTVYCVKVNGVGGNSVYWMLGVARSVAGRRLLEWNNGSSYLDIHTFNSHNAMCADAFAIPETLPHIHAQCVEWCRESVSFLQSMELFDSMDSMNSNVFNPCALATVDDVVQAFRRHPVILPSILAHPDVALSLIVHLTPLHTLKRAHASITRAMHVIWHFAHIDNITSVLKWNTTSNGKSRLYSTDKRVVPDQAVQILQATWTFVNLTLPFFHGMGGVRKTDDTHPILHITTKIIDTRSPSHVRHLLFVETLQRVDESIQELENLRSSYANQIGDIFNYRYAEVSTAHTRAAWLYDFGPDRDLQHRPCQILLDLTGILKEALVGLDIALRSQYAQSRPAKDLGDAMRIIFPKSTPLTAGDVESAEKEQDPFARIVAQVIRYTFGWTGISPDGVFAGLRTLIQNFEISFECDYLAVQTCNKWRVHVIHALIIYGTLFAVAWTLFSSLGMGFLFSLATPLLLLIVLGTCYSYYWSCFPMIPVCLVEDFISGIRSVLPRQLWVPAALTQTTCIPHSTLPSPACIKRCSSEPVSFNTWMAPVAWWAVELDISSTSWIRWFPAGNEDQYILEHQLRLAIYQGDDNDLKSANRICTLFTLHMTLPYIFTVIFALVFFRVGFGIVLEVIQNWITTLTFLFVSVATDADLPTQTTCSAHSGNFQDTAKLNICNNYPFNFKRCVDPSNVQGANTINVQSIQDSGAIAYTQAKCDQMAVDLNTILSDGCIKMGGTLKTPTKCDKSQFCLHAQQKTTMTSTCSVDADCPSPVAVQTSFPLCCPFIKGQMKQACTKYNDDRAQLYVDNLVGDHCTNVDCVGGTGSAVRVARVFSFLVVVLSVFVGVTH